MDAVSYRTKTWSSHIIFNSGRQELQRILAERLLATGIHKLNTLADKVISGDISSSMKAVNLNAGLVQYFFHIHVEEWISTVGKKS